MPLLVHPVWVALAAGLIPLVAVPVAYALSVAEGQVPLCLPLIEGCTSISRAARHGWANHWFKATMLPAASLVMLFWWLGSLWLQSFGDPAPRRRRAMLALGVIAALFLILYATFLGVEGKTYQWLRRYGVTVYFSFTVLAQMMLASVLHRRPQIGARTQPLLVALCGAMLLLGVASVPLQNFAANADAAVNAIEWCYALLMTSVFPLVGLAWHRSGFRLQVQPTHR